jgi:hypothetical protein
MVENPGPVATRTRVGAWWVQATREIDYEVRMCDDVFGIPTTNLLGTAGVGERVVPGGRADPQQTAGTITKLQRYPSMVDA